MNGRPAPGVPPRPGIDLSCIGAFAAVDPLPVLLPDSQQWISVPRVELRGAERYSGPVIAWDDVPQKRLYRHPVFGPVTPELLVTDALRNSGVVAHWESWGHSYTPARGYGRHPAELRFFLREAGRLAHELMVGCDQRYYWENIRWRFTSRTPKHLIPNPGTPRGQWDVPWVHPSTLCMGAVEVKGPGDRLQDTQHAWLEAATRLQPLSAFAIVELVDVVDIEDDEAMCAIRARGKVAMRAAD